MKTTSLQVRIPQALRKEADIVLDSVGIDMSTAIRVYLKKIVSTRGIPFALVSEDSRVLEYVPVDNEIQAKLNKVDRAWKRIKSQKK